MDTSSQTRKKTALVVGAGVGGIAVAARLAKAGVDVTVLEANDFTGGRCSLIHHDGHRFDQGPSLLLLPEMFEETFEDLGTSIDKEGVKLFKCDPNYTMHFADGEHFTLSTDTCVMKEQVEKWEGKDGFTRYLGFLQEAHVHYEESITHVLRMNFTSLASMLRPAFLRRVMALHPFESMYSRVSRYFKTERIRRVFTFASMYMGMSPFDAPGTYSLLQYTELTRGIWYPEGGFHAIIEAIEKIARRTGVKFRLSTPVSQVLLSPDQSRATGVVLSNGERLTADVVIINADLVYAYNNLFPPSAYASSLATRAASCSSISFYWSVDRSLSDVMSAHNIFLAQDYRESFDQIFDDQTMPREPSFYVNVPSQVDSTAAPDGKESVVVLVPVGHMKDPKGVGIGGQDEEIDGMIKKAREHVLETIKARIGLDLRPSIVHEIVNDPRIWKERFNLDRGAILGLSHDFFNVLSFRPKTRHPSVSSCFFVGASTHPGTGVPIVLAGAKLTSEQVLKDISVSVPWEHGAHVVRKVSKEMDGIKVDWWDSLVKWWWFLLALVIGLVARII